MEHSKSDEESDVVSVSFYMSEELESELMQELSRQIGSDAEQGSFDERSADILKRLSEQVQEHATWAEYEEGYRLYDIELSYLDHQWLKDAIANIVVYHIEFENHEIASDAYNAWLSIEDQVNDDKDIAGYDENVPVYPDT